MPADSTLPSVPDLQRRVDELAAELRARTSDHEEALRREAAIAEILQVTNESGGDLAKVFATMIAKAAELCAAPLGHIWTYDGERTHPAAVHGDPGFTEWLMRQGSIRPGGPETPLGRVLLTGRLVHTIDAREEEGYRGNHPVYRELVDRAAIRSILVVPMRKGDALLGVISVYRRERRPFTPDQIRLLEAFAEQAVIAMENARLLAEQREALEQQTATAEVLQVINSSPGDLAPVFDAMLDKATRLSEAAFGILWTYDGERFQAVAFHSVPPGYVEFLQEPQLASPVSALGRVARGEAFAHVPDLAADEYQERAGFLVRQGLSLAGFRTVLAVAMRKDASLLGAITIYRREVQLFSDKQVALLQNFAAQAVIAMENARLLGELRESLDQQTATTEVLAAINSSPGDLTPVFESMLEKAHALCRVEYGSLQLYDGTMFRAVAVHNLPDALAARLREGYAPGPAFQRLTEGADFDHTPDVAEVDDPMARTVVDAGIRTLLRVALRKDGKLLGQIVAARKEVRPFADKEIALLQSFASQAVIAMENARLLGELRQRTDDLTESLEYQTATSEVLEVIGRSTSDIQPVLDTMLSAALRLCRTQSGGIAIQQGDKFRYIATLGWDPEADRVFRSMEITPGRGTVAARVLAEGRVVQVPDVASDSEFERRDMARLTHWHTALGVPLMREGRPIGAIAITRNRVEPFTERQIALVRTFADQAVIAMENARLLGELRQRQAELARSVDELTAITDVLKIISRSPSQLQPVLDTIANCAVRLCGARMGAVYRFDGELVHLAAHHNYPPEALADLQKIYPRPPRTDQVSGRAILTRDVAQIEDSQIDPLYRRELAIAAGWRSQLGVPMLRDGEPIGAIAIARSDAGRFSDAHIEVLKTFADQAVIAIENTRLFTELRESLEQQTATAQVLQVINASRGNLEPIFDVILEKAIDLCGAKFGVLFLHDGKIFTVEAARNVPPAYEEAVRGQAFDPGTNPVLHHLREHKAPLQVKDVFDEAYVARDPLRVATIELAGVRSLVAVPLLNSAELIGFVGIYRDKPGGFADGQIALVSAFADQAVIAIENARLLSELRQRTDDVQESLEYQIATSEVLEVIGRSTSDLQPVLDTMLAAALRLCNVQSGGVAVRRGDTLHYIAAAGHTPEFRQFLQNHAFPINHANAGGRAVLGGTTVHIPDVETEPGYAVPETVRLGRQRAMLSVPLMRQGDAVGVITLSRVEPRPFTERQIGLIETFADQAVIAMENARLLGELRASLEQQTATSDVLKTISRSSVGLEAVLHTLVETVSRLCRADLAYMFRQEDELYHLVAAHGLSEEARAFVLAHPIAAEDRRTVSGRVAVERRTVHIADVLEDPGYSYGGQQTAGYRTMLGIPLLRESTLIGIFNVARTRVEPFTPKEIELAASFADQAVIAIENARLFDELRDRQAELRVTFDNMGDGVAMFDAEPRLAAWNRNFEEIIGLPDALLAERPSYADYLRMLAERGEFGTENVEAELASRLEDTARELRLERTRADGTVIEVRRNAVPGGGFVLIYSDVTAQRQAEATIRAARDAAEVALERQTATADILKVIASSPIDVRPVLNAVVKAAVRFCSATDAMIQLREGDSVISTAHEGPLTYSAGARRSLDRTTAGGRSIIDAQTCHLPDVEALEAAEFVTARRMATQHGFRASVAAPLKREGAAIGAVVLRKVEPGPFTPQQIQLLETFAAQAVIAIENVRLFTELKESLEQQTATSEILRAISQSPTDVQPVLKAVVGAARRFCGADDAMVVLREETEQLLATHEGSLQSLVGTRLPLDRSSATGRATIDGQTFHVPDVASLDPTEHAMTIELTRRTGIRSLLAAPMLREGQAIGCVLLRRPTPGAFTPRQIELLEAFAAQAVIAIENVRLFTELRDSLERLKAAQANLIQSEKMASLGQLTAGIAHEIKNPLNFVNNFAGLSGELLDELKEAAAPVLAGMNKGARAEFAETVELLTGNLRKIAEHGRRADGIVKSMLSHSRGGTGDWQESNINALVEEALNLAYHGARAQDQDFNVTLERNFAPEAKPIEVVPQDVTRVFLNLFGNGFYATRNRHLGGVDAGYRPTLRVSTRDLGEAVEVRVRDNGTGIQPEVRAKLFQPFFTTKPTGEGTGLGLSISYDIVTQQHGGTIEVESEPGSFTEFTVRLPRRRRVAQSRGT